MGSLVVEGLTFRYPQGARLALAGVSFEARPGSFTVVCGRSGCGKSTLLRHCKTALSPHGERAGRVLWDGAPLEDVDERSQAAQIGFVQQQPDNQIVTDTVWRELAFGLENLGVASDAIRRRVAEMASFFGIHSWMDMSVFELSGGQKQLLNLAAVMVLQPSLLVLDEPTAQLDPIAAMEFLNTLRRINRELGTSVVISEHRLEEVLPLADRVLVLEEGRVVCHDDPHAACCALAASGCETAIGFPAPAQAYFGVEGVPADASALPLTVREGRLWLEGHLTVTPLADGVGSDGRTTCPAPASSASPSTGERAAGRALAPSVSRRSVDAILELSDVWFRYEKHAPDVLSGLSLTVERGTWHGIMGGNGAGKSTALGVAGGLIRPYRGSVRFDGRALARWPERDRYRGNIGVLPQNPQTLFVARTVEDDLAQMLIDVSDESDGARRIDRVCELTEISDLIDRHPFDLSGGEQQRVALAKVLLSRPRLLLLDEPTKGLDGPYKRRLARILHRLQDEGVTILMVSHDVEFCARAVDCCSLLFNGSVVSTEPVRAFFAGNSFYTTSTSRMARHLVPGAIVPEDVIHACQAK